MSVTAMPGAASQVAAQSGHAGLDVGDLGERGHRAAHAGVEIRLRAAPVRAEEAVGAVVRDEEWARLDAPQRLSELVDRREDRAIDRPDLWEIIVDQPEARERGVPAEDHHALPGDSRQLGEAARAIGPVMHGEDAAAA